MDTAGHWNELTKWMPWSQREAIIEIVASGEESDWFVDKIEELGQRIDEMPHTYQQDGKGDDAICYLHFFKGACDFYVMEKDIETDANGVHRQAFGYCDLGMGFPELGYIDMQELMDNGIELDLHFTPTRLGDVKRGHKPYADHG